jgi:2-hydroxy-4-carboxymuconate semialdehyde hemiacetal dehydrogenase
LKGESVRHNHLFNGCDRRIDVAAVDVSTNGIGSELHDRAPAAAIREKREPDASVQQVLPCYRAPPELEATLA